MPRRLILVGLGLLVITATVVVLTRSADPDSSSDDEAALETRIVAAGEVDVKIEPRQLDDRGAVFAITLDTHSGDLSADLTSATLDVSGLSWPGAAWSGDEPGGHHREGELRFESGGVATGTARLALPGFPRPVEVTWELGG